MKLLLIACLALAGCATYDPGYIQRVQVYQSMQRPVYVVPAPPQMLQNHSGPNYVCSPGTPNTLYCQGQ